MKFSKEKATGMIENAKSKFRQSFELIQKAKESGARFAANRKAEGDKAPAGTENEHKSLY